jgi:hypothetical protein
MRYTWALVQVIIDYGLATPFSNGLNVVRAPMGPPPGVRLLK